VIRYPVTRKELLRRADTPKEGGHASWTERASVLLKLNEAAGQFATKGKDIWGEIKDVYGRLQHFKCAYCERQLPHSKPDANGSPGSVERDVEHFRPKSSVRPWKIPAELAGDGIKAQGAAVATGYFKLAYDVENYAIACKTCNSSLKGDRFPIEGTRDSGGSVPSRLNRREKPYLIFPIGSIDKDPESLIAFRGATPVAVQKAGTAGYRRARATIAFFRLADADLRSDLFAERARIIKRAYLASLLLASAGEAADKAFAQETLAEIQRPDQPHANCARSFVKLCKRDPVAARKIAEAARDLVLSKSPK
jgi:hypothetical protein